MKISKLLQIILGLSGFLRMGVTDGDSGGSMGVHDAGAAFAGMGDSGEQAEETEDAAAERLAAEEAAGATQKAGDESEQVVETADSDTITIQVDGKDVQLKKADLPELYKGGLRQQDYTQKTMAAAEQAKTAQAEITKARQERDTYAQQLNTFAVTTQSLLAEQQKVLTIELAQTDPAEYQIQKHIFDQRQVELNKAQNELHRLQGEYQKEQQQEAQEFMRNQQAKLIEAFPDWKDPEKAKKHVGELETFMGKQGFSAEDGRTVLDARVMILADKAMRYDALLARAKESAGKVKAAPVSVERPGVVSPKATDGRTTAMKQLEKSGSVRDAGAVFANF